MDIGAVNKRKGQEPKIKGKNKGKSKSDKGKKQPRGKGKGKSKGPQVFRLWQTWTFCRRCDQRVRTVNEVTKTTRVNTVSIKRQPRHTRGVMCTTGALLPDMIGSPHSLRHPQLFELHGKQHKTPGRFWRNNSCGPANTAPHHSAHPRNSCHSKKCWWSGIAPCWSKAESYVYRSLKFQVNYEVAPFVRPFVSVDVLTSRGVSVVFGVDGTQNCHDQRKWSNGVRHDVG